MAGLVDSTERRIVCGATISKNAFSIYDYLEFFAKSLEKLLLNHHVAIFFQFPRLTHWLRHIADLEDVCLSSRFWWGSMTQPKDQSRLTQNFTVCRHFSFTRILMIKATYTILRWFVLVNRLFSHAEFSRHACHSDIEMKDSLENRWKPWDGKQSSHEKYFFHYGTRHQYEQRIDKTCLIHPWKGLNGIFRVTIWSSSSCHFIDRRQRKLYIQPNVLLRSKEGYMSVRFRFEDLCMLHPSVSIWHFNFSQCYQAVHYIMWIMGFCFLLVLWASDMLARRINHLSTPVSLHIW